MTGVPTKAYRLPTEWIQPGTTVVNVASFKNVDEDALLQIPGVVYVPQVGKVTVAMLERNLMRLYDQFHHHNIPDIYNNMHNRHGDEDVTVKQQQQQQPSWYYGMAAIQMYTAAAVTVLIALKLAKY